MGLSDGYRMACRLWLIGSISFACGAPPRVADDNTGQVAFALTLPGGGTIAVVNYLINGNGIAPITGTIDVSASGTTVATALVGGLGAGSYTVSMGALASDGTQCTGSAPFTVVPRQTATASVVLQCTRTHTTGAVAVSGQLLECPTISGLSATSLEAPSAMPAKRATMHATATWNAGAVRNAGSASRVLRGDASFPAKSSGPG